MSASAGSNWRNMPANDSFNIGWRYITKKVLSANMDSDSEICLIGIFGVGFMRDYGRGNQFSKAVHDESGKDLLAYVLHLFLARRKILWNPKAGINGVFAIYSYSVAL